MMIKCPSCSISRSSRSGGRKILRAGTFWRKSDGHHIPRFRCLPCGKHFSSATLSSKYRQKKRQVNEKVYRLLGAGVSQREAARVLNLNRKTIARRLIFLGRKCEMELDADNLKHAPAKQVEFDDLETIEHTKCKPVAVSLMVEYKSRRILGLEVAQMPAKGLLARISRRKYGPRSDDRPRARNLLFEKVKDLLEPDAIIRSDSNPHYPDDIKKHFPLAKHETVLSRRGAITAQGELKKQGFDPIFSLNHTCAMFRAHVGRLIRRTWNTTKKIDRLRLHLMIYAHIHNRRLSAA